MALPRLIVSKGTPHTTLANKSMTTANVVASVTVHASPQGMTHSPPHSSKLYSRSSSSLSSSVMASETAASRLSEKTPYEFPETHPSHSSFLHASWKTLSDKLALMGCSWTSFLAFQQLENILFLDCPSFYVALIAITFTPIFWNGVARAQYQHQWLTQTFQCSPSTGCYVVAFFVFIASAFRDLLFQYAISQQPRAISLADPGIQWLSAMCLVLGTGLVLLSTYRLGIRGTYLGDYFGFVKRERIVAFPFDILKNPMYVGSSLNFVGYALRQQSAAGLVLSAYAFLVYMIAAYGFEGPFTDYIYSTIEKH